jgi:hypothetical protein
MNILEAVLNAQGGAAAREAGRGLGLSQEQTGAALGALVPALAAGLQRNASQPGGLESLIGALSGGQHSHYLDDPSSLGKPETIADGNAILGHILGTKDASRTVATHAASRTGIDPALLKQLLPIAATMVMGAMAKKQLGGGMAATASVGGATGGGLLGMLTPLLDQNRDGSIVDDVLGKFLGGR